MRLLHYYSCAIIYAPKSTKGGENMPFFLSGALLPGPAQMMGALLHPLPSLFL